jgi:YVTN family beta-propeller protein
LKRRTVITGMVSAAALAACGQVQPGVPTEGVAGKAAEKPVLKPLKEFIYVFNNGSKSVSVIDGTAQELVSTIPIEGYPDGIGVAVHNPVGQLWTTFHGDKAGNGVFVLETPTLKTLKTLTIEEKFQNWDKDGVKATAFVYAEHLPDTKWAWVTVSDTNDVRVIDKETFTEVKKIPTDVWPCDIDVRVGHGFTYTPNRFADNVSLVDLNASAEVARIPTVPHAPAKAEPYMLTLAPDGAHVVVEFAKAPIAAVLDTKSRQFVKVIELPKPAVIDEFTPDGRLDFMIYPSTDFISVIDTATWQIKKEIKFPGNVSSADFSADSKFAYVPVASQNLLTVIDLAKLEIVKTIRVGANPVGVIRVHLEKAPGT